MRDCTYLLRTRLQRSMLTYESIKNHFADLVARGENAKSTATNYYTNTIFKVLNDPDGFDDPPTCLNTKVVEHINQTHDHPGTRQGVL